MKFSAPAIAAAFVLLSLSACGQRGPLYLPPPETPPHSSPPVQPQTPVTPAAPVVPVVPKPDDKKDPNQSTNQGTGQN